MVSVTDGFPGPKGRVGHPDPTHFIGQTRDEEVHETISRYRPDPPDESR